MDLVLSKDGEKTLVQCKQWKAFKVGVATVREVYGVMAADGAALMRLLKEAMAQKGATSENKVRIAAPLINRKPVTNLIKMKPAFDKVRLTESMMPSCPQL
uniref:restriction endonuclease n=1 Tax=Delftia acidovorans TaxID=80866 RepID=UPI0021A8D3A9|nr:restriction endonuclease [Delftia acidovorans]